jgi:ubiquinol-cytochrome c reductase cytochrome c subunit
MIVTPSTLAAPGAGGRRRRFASAAIVLVALGLLTLLYGALAPRGSAASSSDPDVDAGRNLFIKYSCASCHGMSGEGGQRAPSLIGVGEASVDFQVGTGRMPLQHHGAQAPRKQPVMDEAQIHQLAKYVASLGPGGPAIPDVTGYQDADVAYGGALFRTNCAQCHNFAGAGGALTYGKSAPALTHSTPTQIYEAMLTGPEAMPVFSDTTVTPAQKRAMIAYITSVRAEPNPGGFSLGRVGPVTEGLVAFLGGIAVLVFVAIWITMKKRREA